MNFQDLHQFEGLQFMPVTAKKRPIIEGWQTTKKKHNLMNCEAVGLVCGKLSGNVEVVDIDLKYDISGNLYENYKRLINEIDSSILPRLVVQKTPSGGYHFIYRCKKIEGNLKLANRPTTNDEKNETYKLELKAGKTKEQAKKIAEKDKVRVLLETRGEGGQIVCFPSKGYELVYGDYYGINEITAEQRDILHGVARQFNQIIEEARHEHIQNRSQVKGTSSFDDFNSRADVLDLLQRNGWKVVNKRGQKTNVLRPGSSSAETSGNFDHEKNWFSVFTTSTEFEPMKAYLPYAVYAILECGGDFKLASQKLYDAGYGDRKETIRELNSNTPSRITVIDDDFSFLAKPEDYEEYLHQVRTGTLQMGLTTGMEETDKHFLFKHGNLVIINGIDNVGKTKYILWMAMLSSLFHKWKWIIYCSENSLGNVVRTLIEFYVGKKLDQISDQAMAEGKTFVEKHFSIIKSEENLFNYRDIINIVKKLSQRVKYDSVLIDPYNSLKIELNNASKLNTHEYHYEAVSELKMYGKRHDIGFYVNMHAVTSAIRQKDQEGYAAAPGKEDTEGGGKFANKADEFLTVHRRTQHPTEWMMTQVYVRKVKEWETGGKPTPLASPLRFSMNKSGVGFSEVDEMGRYTDPIENWRRKNGKQEQLNYSQPLWTPYADDIDF